MPFTDEEWAEIAEELPSADEDVLKKYHRGRAALMAEEDKQRSDYAFRQGLSPIARRACAIVARIRAEEQRTVWTPSVEEQLASEGGAAASVTVFPGMMFSLAKERMEATRLWRIVRRMPKGALLHAHLDAMVPFDHLLDVAMRTPGMHLLCADGHLATPARRATAIPQVRFRRRAHPWPEQQPAASIWETGYAAGTPMPLCAAADAFPDGGRAGFLRWLHGRCTLSRTDAVAQHHGADAIWATFRGCFQTAGALLHYEPVFRAFLRRLLAMLVADGVAWAELRFTWPLDYCREGEDVPEQDYTHMFTVIEEEVARFRATSEGASFWGLRMIWSAIRTWDTRTLLQDMDACIATKLAFPHLVAGYDLVGHEDAGRPLADLLPELFWFRAQCAAEAVALPLLLHAGETLGTGTAADGNLFDAVLLGARRIGHGFSLHKHPQLCAAARDRGVLVEACPVSNEVLRLCGSVLAHPLPALLARGVPCCLANDDPAMLGQGAAGMTHDFWQALQGWESLGLAGLGSLAENSVRWAVFEDQDGAEWARGLREASLGAGLKARRLQEWAVEWERFCLWITIEYADYLDDDDGGGGGGGGGE